MQRFALLTLGLIGAFTAVIFALRLVGAAGRSPFEAILTKPDGTPCEMPCLLGIHPEKTTRDEAIALLNARSDYKNGALMSTGNYQSVYEGNVISKGKSSWFTVYGGSAGNVSDQDKVGMLRYEGGENPIPMGDVILTLGPPRSVLLTPEQGYWTLHLFYENGFLVSSDGTQVQADSPAIIILSGDGDVGPPDAKPWRGFTSYPPT